MALYTMTLRDKKTQARRAKVERAWDAGWVGTKEQFYITLSRRFKCSPNTIKNDLKAIEAKRAEEQALVERLQAEGY